MTDNAEREPTMEEILSSIRRIISEEEVEAAQDSVAATADAADDDGEILELTDIVEASAVVSDHATATEDDVLDLDDGALEPDAAFAAEYEPEHDAAAGMTDADPAQPAQMAAVEDTSNTDDAPRAEAQDGDRETTMSERLISENAAGAAAGAFARLQRATRIPESDDDKSLESIVREMLRPMLKDWLDENLPAIVERAVQEEVERISRQG